MPAGLSLARATSCGVAVVRSLRCSATMIFCCCRCCVLQYLPLQVYMCSVVCSYLQLLRSTLREVVQIQSLCK